MDMCMGTAQTIGYGLNAMIQYDYSFTPSDIHFQSILMPKVNFAKFSQEADSLYTFLNKLCSILFLFVMSHSSGKLILFITSIV